MEAAQTGERAVGRKPVSPELVLVDPALAEAARRQLGAPGTWRPASVASRSSPVELAGRLVPSAARQVPRPAERARPSTSRRLLAVFAAALVTPFVAASGFSLAVLMHNDSQGSLLAPEAIAPDQQVERGRPEAPTASPLKRSSPERRTRRPADRRGSSSRTVTLSGNGVEIGAWALESEPTVMAATSAFGRPSRRRRDPFYCELTWQRLGVQVTFYDIDGRQPCRQGVFVRAVIEGASWRTADGLRIGARVGSIRRRHRQAAKRQQGWWLLAPISRRTFEPWRPDPWLRARVRGGRVVAFYVT